MNEKPNIELFGSLQLHIAIWLGLCLVNLYWLSWPLWTPFTIISAFVFSIWHICGYLVMSMLIPGILPTLISQLPMFIEPPILRIILVQIWAIRSIMRVAARVLDCIISSRLLVYHILKEVRINEILSTIERVIVLVKILGRLLVEVLIVVVVSLLLLMMSFVLGAVMSTIIIILGVPAIVWIIVYVLVVILAKIHRIGGLLRSIFGISTLCLIILSFNRSVVWILLIIRIVILSANNIILSFLMMIHSLLLIKLTHVLLILALIVIRVVTSILIRGILLLKKVDSVVLFPLCILVDALIVTIVYKSITNLQTVC